MVASMRHEPFYVTGTWMDEGMGVYAGWAEREDAAGTANPQRSETGDKVLVFSGEEYSESAAVQRLKELGHKVGSGRSAHLVHSAEEDPAFFAALNGQFQGLLVDRRAGAATLFNDRYASRRIYYHQANDGFYFAAEVKALLAVRPELRVLDERGLGEYVSCGCVLEDRTLFKGIRILPWAAAWVFRGGELAEQGSYFSPAEWESQGQADTHSYYRDLREVFARNLPHYFNGGGQIALSLTGGLDTRMILAWHKPAPQSLPCFTFGGANRESRDVKIARHVAEVCGQTHQVIAVGPDFLSRFAHYAERTVYLTDGCTGVHHAPDLYVNEIARQVAPIRLTGNYGDEILRRRMVFRPTMPDDGVFHSEFLQMVEMAAETHGRVFAGNTLTDAANRQISWFFYGLAALEASQVEVRSPFLDNELMRTVYRAPAHHFADGDVRVQMIRDGDPALGRIRTDLGYAGRGGPVVSAATRLWNCATMRAEYACEHADPRWVPGLDRALLGRKLEKTFVGIHKFTHFSLWYRNALAPYVREILLDPRTLSRPYLEPAQVRTMVERHVSGAGNYTPAIHRLITLEHIHRLFVDAP
ncbi:MAG TPA: asparagine synthase-related protein [Terracidiphilus sp.]|nr:asparagine synthase-related protein [Terracidiphilus sp.]